MFLTPITAKPLLADPKDDGSHPVMKLTAQ